VRQINRLKIGKRRTAVRYKNLPPELYAQIGRDIEIADNIGGEELAYALLHEPMHAIWANSKLPSRPSEERAVTALSRGLIQVFRDNPGYLQHLDALLKESR
jgi:hypothetical protein